MTDGEEQYHKAIAKYETLCLERTDPSQWSENIIDATTGILENIAWTNFYTYLSDDTHEYSSRKTRTLGDALAEGPIKRPEMPVKLKTTCVKNGSLTYIRVTPDISQYIEKHNGRKSMDQLSQAMDEKSPG